MSREGFHPEFTQISDSHQEGAKRVKEFVAFFVLTLGALLHSGESDAQVRGIADDVDGHRTAALRADSLFAQTHSSKDLLDGQMHWRGVAVADSQDIDAALQYIMHKVQYDSLVNAGGLYEDQGDRRVKVGDEEVPTQAVFQEAVAYLRNVSESLTPSDPRKKTIQEAIDKIIAHYVKSATNERKLQDEIRKTVFYSTEVEAQQAVLRRQLSEERRRLREATGKSGPDPESPKYLTPRQRDRFEDKQGLQKFARVQRKPGHDKFPGPGKGGRRVGENKRLSDA